METAIDKAVRAAGSQAELARLINQQTPDPQDRVTPQAVHKWVTKKQAPPKRVLVIEQVTGVTRYELRPDLYGDAAA